MGSGVLTNIFTVSTVNIEGIVAELRVGVCGVKQKTVGAELFLGEVGDTLVVLVALLQVGEEPILLGATEGRTSIVWNTEDEVGVSGWGGVARLRPATSVKGKMSRPRARSGDVATVGNLQESQLSGQWAFMEVKSSDIESWNAQKCTLYPSPGRYGIWNKSQNLVVFLFTHVQIEDNLMQALSSTCCWFHNCSSFQNWES